MKSPDSAMSGRAARIRSTSAQIRLRPVPAVHRLQHPVAPRLHRQVQERHQLRFLAMRRDQVVAHVVRMRGGIADPLEPLDRRQPPHQRRQRRSLAVAVGVHVLPEQRDLDARPAPRDPAPPPRPAPPAAKPRRPACRARRRRRRTCRIPPAPSGTPPAPAAPGGPAAGGRTCPRPETRSRPAAPPPHAAPASPAAGDRPAAPPPDRPPARAPGSPPPPPAPRSRRPRWSATASPPSARAAARSPNRPSPPPSRGCGRC